MKKTFLTLALICSSTALFAQNEETLNKWITTYNELNSTKNWDGMISNFTACHNEVPQWDFAFYYKGVAEYNKQDYANAVKDLAAFTAKIDTVNAAYMFLAQSYNALSQPQDALNALNIYVQKEPNDKNGYLEMANSHQALQDYDNYIADLNKAVAIDANDVSAYKNIASAYAMKQSWGDAVATMNKVMGLEADNQENYYTRGTYNFNLKTAESVKAALEDFTKAEELGMKDLNLYNRMYACNSMLKDNKGAIDICTKMLELNPDNLSVLYNRANAYYKGNEFKSAIADLDKVISGTNDDKTKLNALKTRYMCKKKLNDAKGAAADLELINKMSGK
ncbi:MAG: tetratricopeptide repeat protein [Bacteroidales bacterium]|nr:tetratricopeptide repeat protein [Bacteroidales bacterium]